MAREKILNLISGKLVPPVSGQFAENINPSTGQFLCSVPLSTSQDVELAYEAATTAKDHWAGLSPRERAQFLSKMADLIEADLEAFARAEAEDSGKPISLARNLEIPRSASNLRFFAEAISQFRGESFHTSASVFNYTEHAPLGVVGCISPWNLPLYLFTWKIAPALAAGNTVLAKPSEVTPLTAFLLSEVAIKADLPAGVLNIIHGTGPEVGEPIVRHEGVKAISFTGSTGVGRRIGQICGESLKKVSLELGGKNANIIFTDAPLAKAVEFSVRSSFQNQGQICLCGSRILIHSKIYEEFKQLLLSGTRALIQGDPLDSKTQQGALVSKDHFQKVQGYVEKARAEGGRILCGGKPAHLGGALAQGYFYEPTLIEGLPFDSSLNQEEIFGPVATLIPFSSDEEAVRIANGTKYGLSCSLWTKDLARAHRTASQIQSGIVWINTWMNRDLRTPFGGVKQSGVGREGGFEALKFFTETKNICIDTTYGENP